MADGPARRARCHTDRVADAELLAVIRAAGHGPLLDVLGRAEVYTAAGRLNVVAAAAAAGLSWRAFRRRLGEMRTLIGGDDALR